MATSENLPPAIHGKQPGHAGLTYLGWRVSMVGAVGIELKATLKTRKLLILLNEKNAKNGEYARVRYTAGTRTGTSRY